MTRGHRTLIVVAGAVAGSLLTALSASPALASVEAATPASVDQGRLIGVLVLIALVITLAGIGFALIRLARSQEPASGEKAERPTAELTDAV
jgi:multisubunit Na+/H+ antiporter MnhC subunit